MFFPCCSLVHTVDLSAVRPFDVSGSALEIRAPLPLDKDVLGVIVAAGISVDVSVIQQAGCNLSDLFEPSPDVPAPPVTTIGVSGPLPPEILNTFEKLSRSNLPLLPESEDETKPELSDSATQTVKDVIDAVVQTAVSIERLKPPVLR